MNLYRVYCAGDLGYEDAVAALKKKYPKVPEVELTTRLDRLATRCSLALLPLPQSDQPDTSGDSSEGA